MHWFLRRGNGNLGPEGHDMDERKKRIDEVLIQHETKKSLHDAAVERMSKMTWTIGIPAMRLFGRLLSPSQR